MEARAAGDMTDSHEQSSTTSTSRSVTPRAAMTVAALRRSNSQHTPTRTLRISEAEESSRESTPLRLTVEELSTRPRSNQRSRTPMRYESPLNPGEFRRDTSRAEVVENESTHHVARQITIRPLAGSAVGTIAPVRFLDVDRVAEKSRSSKQGPSHRKVRRWNNDNFTSLAAEVAAMSNVRKSRAAEVLLLAQHDIKHYRTIYNPADSKSAILSSFMQDEKLQSLRERFFEGDVTVPMSSSRLHHPPATASRLRAATGTEMMARIDPRLRRIVCRACTNSFPASKVVESFEQFIVESFILHCSDPKLPEGWWTDLLLESPTVHTRNDSNRTANFFFEADSPTGGFHRLLLHAACQFYGLQATSRQVDLTVGQVQKASRALLVYGCMEEDPGFRLLDIASQEPVTTPSRTS